MVKLYRIPGTDVKIRISQDEVMSVWIEFEGNDNLLLPEFKKDKVIIQALGFPTEKTEPKPIDGGDLEEVTE